MTAFNFSRSLSKEKTALILPKIFQHLIYAGGGQFAGKFLADIGRGLAVLI